MNKFLTKITSLALGAAMVVGVGVASSSKRVGEVKAEPTNEHTFDLSSSVPSDLTASISLSADSNGRGMGKGGADYSLTTSASFENVVKVVVNAATNYGTYANHKISVTVGGASFDSQKSFSAKASTDYTFESSQANGVIVVSFDNSADGTTKSNTIWCKTIEVWTEAGSSATLESISLSGSMTKTSYTTAESWSHEGFTVTAHYDDESTKDVTNSATWEYSPEEPTVSTTSVTATATFGEKSATSSAQTVSVTEAHSGTADDPFTVVEALAKANEIGAVGKTGQGPWVTRGIITRIVEAPKATYWNATYYISDDGKQANELQVYRGFYVNNAKFTEETALELVAGATVVITGNLTGSYGCEYCANNYMLSITAPETGDVDVTFEPTTSYEIGATGTFSATSETAGVTFTWSVDKADVLSVDATTGTFEAKSLGVARVTVTATAGDKEGFAFADITVNAKDTFSVSEADAIAAALPSGTTTSYYIYVEGFVKEFGTSMKDTSPRAFDIMDLSGNKIMIYTNVDPYAAFIAGLKLGDYIKVKGHVQNYNGTYEITSPEKVSSRYSYVSFAFELISSTDEVCSSYGTDNYNYDDSKTQFANVWTTLSGASSFGALEPSDVQELVKAHGVEASSNPVEVAMYRYDLITAKYALDNFINERVIPTYSYVPEFENNVNSSNSIGIIVIVAVSSMTLLGLTLVIRKRKHQ